MTHIIHPQNFRAIRALDAQKRRPGDVLKDGERLHFNVNLIDSAARRTTDARAASIDETVKGEIERVAKLAGRKASEWLATATPREIERIVESAAKAHVTALGGEGIARGFAMDSVIRRTVDAQHGAHDAKFAFMGDSAPAFDRERAEFLARAKFGVSTGDSAALSDADMTRALSASRYGGTAPLIDAEAQPKASAPAMHDAGGRARPAAINALRAARYQG